MHAGERVLFIVVQTVGSVTLDLRYPLGALLVPSRCPSGASTWQCLRTTGSSATLLGPSGRGITTSQELIEHTLNASISLLSEVFIFEFVDHHAVVAECSFFRRGPDRA